MAMNLYDWKMQLGRDKTLFEQAKSEKKAGRRLQTGWKTEKGKKRKLYAVEYYGGLYRESLAGYKRALARSKAKKRLKEVM